MANKSTDYHGQLLSIGVVARSLGVSQNSIRRVEAAGLMQPALTVLGSGYRYYDSDNLAVLAEIFALKSVGFTQDDILEYLTHPGNYESLYEKLLLKQSQLDQLVKRFGRRVDHKTAPSCEVLSFAQADCLCECVRMRPEADAVSDASKEILFQTVQAGLSIDYTRPILILTECRDYRTFQLDTEQALTFCIPLTERAEDARIRHFPSATAICAAWNRPFRDYAPLIPLIAGQMERGGLTQQDTLRISYDIGGYMGKHISEEEMLGHVLVPVSGAPL